jgi:hypothetical protein
VEAGWHGGGRAAVRSAGLHGREVAGGRVQRVGIGNQAGRVTMAAPCCLRCCLAGCKPPLHRNACPAAGPRCILLSALLQAPTAPCCVPCRRRVLPVALLQVPAAPCCLPYIPPLLHPHGWCPLVRPWRGAHSGVCAGRIQESC